MMLNNSLFVWAIVCLASLHHCRRFHSFYMQGHPKLRADLHPHLLSNSYIFTPLL